MADIVGYTRLVELDTDGTIAAWKAARTEEIEPAISEFSGRIVKLTGDGFLAEFSSVQDVVNCAVELQRRLGHSPLEFRMGISLGDVVDDGEDIYGEGVNIAARIESLALPRGISIAGPVYEAVKNRVDVSFEDTGEHSVKNVSEPVRIYRVIDSQHTHDDSDSPVLELPDKPSIAVLPFDNMSGDPEQEYFSDGVVEDIITALSSFRSIFVIARNSSFAYKGIARNIKSIGAELGVRYVLEGSVRKSATRVRITAQLIEASSGVHLWAQRYDRVLEDVFELQDEITETIVAAIEPELEVAERERAYRKSTGDLDAWENYQRGMWHAYNFSGEEAMLAEPLFNTALDNSPNYAPALTGLAWLDFQRVLLDFTSRPGMSREDLLGRGIERAMAAVAIDDKDAFSHYVFGRLLSLQGDFDEAEQRLNQSIELNPNLALAYHGRGYLYAVIGEPARAIPEFDTALRLSPQDPYRWGIITMRACALLLNGEYSEAVDNGRHAIRLRPEVFWAHAHVASALGHLDRFEEAHQAYNRLMQCKPEFSESTVDQTVKFRLQETRDHYLSGLYKAGMPRSDESSS